MEVSKNILGGALKTASLSAKFFFVRLIRHALADWPMTRPTSSSTNPTVPAKVASVYVANDNFGCKAGFAVRKLQQLLHQELKLSLFEERAAFRSHNMTEYKWTICKCEDMKDEQLSMLEV